MHFVNISIANLKKKTPELHDFAFGISILNQLEAKKGFEMNLPFITLLGFFVYY